MKLIDWNLPEAEREALHRRLCFEYFKWDVHASGRCLIWPEAIRLSVAEHAAAVRISERFSSILGRLETALLTRPDRLLELGIPPAVLPLVTADQPLDMQLARYDLFLTPEGQWMVSEFNEDAPGGFNEAVGLSVLLGSGLDGVQFAGDLRARVAAAFAPHGRVALLYATGYADDLQHVLLVQQWLEQAGHETVLASPAHLRAGWRGLCVGGVRCEAAFRFYPGEWYGWLENQADWRRALAAFPMMNPLRRLIRQSKRLYAIWRDPSLLSAEDIAFIDAHTPHTVPFDASRVPEWLAMPAAWVLKRAFGRMGDSVIMGSLVSPAAWQAALNEATRQPREWLMQACFGVTPLARDARPLYPTLGVYIVNDRFAGYYSRAAHEPFINHEAYHVATLVETA